MYALAAAAGIPQREVDDSSLSYIIARIQGVYSRQDSEGLERWRATRWLACVLVNLQMPKGRRMTVQQLLKLPNDPEKAPKAAPSGRSAMEAIVKQYNEGK